LRERDADLIVFGKGLGGGLPLSAVIGPRQFMDYAPAFALQTTAGNLIAAAAGRAVLQAIADEGLVERAMRVGRKLSSGLRACRHAMIGEVRGRGLALGMDLVSDRPSRELVPVSTSAKVIYRAYQLGAVFFYLGLRRNVLEITPPLTLSETEAEATPYCEHVQTRRSPQSAYRGQIYLATGEVPQRGGPP
jgi:4-aminobutyrate aminotransferase